MNFHIESCEVFGIERCVVASGNSYRTEIRPVQNLNDNDWARGVRLGKVAPGTGHDTLLSGITVLVDVYAPLYWWKQAQRYHWFEFVSSQSTMHCLMKFDIETQCVDATNPEIMKIVKDMVEEYKTMDDSNPDKQRKWKEIVASLPCGFVLGATMTTNYRQLKTMYLQRKNHRLTEWHDFCNWCESLPHFKQLCLGEE